MDLNNLINITPIPEEKKKELISLSETADKEKLLEIKDFCWDTLLANAELKKQELVTEYMIKVQKGEAKYSDDEIKKIDEQVFNELNNKINDADTSTQMNEVRQKLQEQANPTS